VEEWRYGHDPTVLGFLYDEQVENGWILAIFGYQGGSFLPQTKPGIILIVGPLPILWYILGLLILRHYPIDQAYYNEMIKRGE
jgi:Na+/melibiose symporter-like transporter